MLELCAMIQNGVTDAVSSPPAPLACTGCRHLTTRQHPAGTAGPHGTSARCHAPAAGPRVIGWEWQPQDRPPPWCPGWEGAR